ISGRLGLDHDRVLFGKYAFPVMARYIDHKGGKLADVTEQGKLLYWYLQSAMWGRFSGSAESSINQDIVTFERDGAGLDGLIREMRLWRGDLKILPDHFGGWSCLGSCSEKRRELSKFPKGANANGQHLLRER
ncbi:unnamed protein product, partial [marine sediment metagenome]